MKISDHEDSIIKFSLEDSNQWPVEEREEGEGRERSHSEAQAQAGPMELEEEGYIKPWHDGS